MGSALRGLRIGEVGVGGCRQAAQELGQLLFLGRRQHLEQLRRGGVVQCAEAVQDAIHNNEMEGLHVNADTLADADEYVAGRIDSDELVARARARYGLA